MMKGYITIAIGCLLLLAVAISAVTGYGITLVPTGSMEPEIKTNALVITQRTPYEQLKEGDIIRYKTEEEGQVIHRISRKYPQGFIMTKGDSNQMLDLWVIQESMYSGARVVGYWNEVAPIITVLRANAMIIAGSLIALGLVLRRTNKVKTRLKGVENYEGTV